MNKTKSFLWLLVVLAVFALTSCSEWPNDFNKKIKAIPQEIEAANKKIAELETKYDGQKKSKDFKVMAQYAEREKWDKKIVTAKNEMARVKGIYDKELLPAYKNGKKEELQKAMDNYDRCKKIRLDAVDIARYPSQRAEFLVRALVEAPAWVNRAKEEAVQTGPIFEKFKVYAQNAQSDYPEKRDDIKGKISAVEIIHKETQEALTKAQKELKSKDPDYAMLGDNCTLVTAKLNEIKSQDGKLRDKIKQLYRSYSKTIADMKIVEKPWKKVVRYEWDNWSDWDTTHVASDQKVSISMSEYQQLEPKMSSNPDGYKIDSGSDYEVLIEDIDVDYHYYHKYTLTEGDKQKDGDWEEVSENVYEADEDNLNMDILVKPYGMYESEVSKVATPPGMAYVGNPKYGRWEKDPATGEKRWGWFENYLFYSWLFGGNTRHYYYYNDYNDWNRNYRGRSPYYGRGDNERYGTYGSTTRANKKYANSTFAKAGGFKSQDTSVRGAGPSSRGRGPGGGGK